MEKRQKRLTILFCCLLTATTIKVQRSDWLDGSDKLTTIKKKKKKKKKEQFYI